MGLKELQSWRLVKLMHQVGDRRDYFETPKDVWEIFRILMEESASAKSTPRSRCATRCWSRPPSPPMSTRSSA